VVSAQSADVATIDQLTAKAMKHLTTFSRYTYKSQTYGDMEFGKNFGSETVTADFGENKGVMRSSIIRFDQKTENKYGSWVNGDQIILTKEPKGGTVISRQSVAWATEKDARAYSGLYIDVGLGEYFLPSSAEKYTRSLNPDSWPYQEPQNSTTTITESAHKGRPCYKVVVAPASRGGPLRVITTEYLLDKQHGMVLGKKRNGLLHSPKGSRGITVLDVDQLTEITYGPPTENGLPFPTAVKGWYVWPTGRREPMTDIEFSEFKRYTPSAEELDFEKQFGIPLPALPPKPGVLAKAGGNRVTRWLAGGLALTVIAALVVLIRRRRTARRGGPAPAKTG
jgi:hypothetical protein